MRIPTVILLACAAILARAQCELPPACACDLPSDEGCPASCAVPVDDPACLVPATATASPVPIATCTPYVRPVCGCDPETGFCTECYPTPEPVAEQACTVEGCPVYCAEPADPVETPD